MAWFEDGTARIYYEDSGSGDPVLLLPGLSDRIEKHTVVREALTKAGYRVIAADPPGSGRSLPQPRRYTVSYYEEDAGALLALLRQLTRAPAHLFGFSDGGEYALLMAEMQPDAVRSIVTWGASGVLADPSGMLFQTMYNIVDAPPPPMQGYRDSLVADYGEANARTMMQSATLAIDAIIKTRGGEVSLTHADQIICPALLIAGEYDMFTTEALLDQLAARIPDAEVLVVKDAGHDVHNDRPEWFADLILDWVKKH